MDDAEKASVTKIAKLVDLALVTAGYNPSVRQNLNVTFKKAVLTIDDAERSSGAFHNLADGKPFYRMQISAGEKTLMDAQNDQTAALVFYLMQVMGNGSMTIGGPLVLDHDFRGDIEEKGIGIAQAIYQLKNHVVKPKDNGPRPN